MFALLLKPARGELRPPRRIKLIQRARPRRWPNLNLKILTFELLISPDSSIGRLNPAPRAPGPRIPVPRSILGRFHPATRFVQKVAKESYLAITKTARRRWTERCPEAAFHWIKDRLSQARRTSGLRPPSRWPLPKRRHLRLRLRRVHLRLRRNRLCPPLRARNLLCWPSCGTISRSVRTRPWLS